MDDNLYPNDSEALGIYEPDEEVDTAQIVELQQMASAYPIMDELIAWFDEKVQWYGSIHSVEVGDEMDDWKISRQIMVNKLMTNLLTAKRDELRYKFAAYKQAMNPKPGESDE